MSERTPQQIIGDDAFNQLVFEGYVVTRPAPAPVDWKCGALAQGTAGGSDPADCDYPHCGCDPNYVTPAATDTGPVTVAWQRQSSFYADGWGPVDAAHAQKLAAAGEPVRELVTRSQAEELLAAERAESERLRTYILRAEKAEAKLAAAMEALIPFADCCDHIRDDEDDEEWAKFRLLVKDYRHARSAVKA